MVLVKGPRQVQPFMRLPLSMTRWPLPFALVQAKTFVWPRPPSREGRRWWDLQQRLGGSHDAHCARPGGVSRGRPPLVRQLCGARGQRTDRLLQQHRRHSTPFIIEFSLQAACVVLMWVARVARVATGSMRCCTGPSMLGVESAAWCACARAASPLFFGADGSGPAIWTAPDDASDGADKADGADGADLDPDEAMPVIYGEGWLM